MSKKRTNWPKYVLQWGVLAAIVGFICFAKTDPEKYCPMGGIQALVTYIVRGSLPCSMNSLQIMMGIALAVAVVLFSKLFCAFICPLGAVEDLLTKLRRAIGLNAIEIKNGSVADKILRIFKYGLLFWIFYTTATASELFCKNLDPYYAVATGFKGEITLWMSIVALVLLILFGLFVDRFWCRYICPLGAASNTLKFYVPFAAVILIGAGLSALGLEIPWWAIFAAVCLMGYLLEIFYAKPKLQLLSVTIDKDRCTRTCRSCQKNCPYAIDVPSFNGRVTSVDCMLCGECISACPTKCLSVGIAKPTKKWTRFIPAALAVILVAAGMIVGSRFELPTIDENWGIEPGMKIETVKIEGLKTVKCYGSSMTFKARMERVAGVHGVKTYVGSHNVIVKFDSAVTTAEKVRESAFTPSKFRIISPDPKQTDSLVVYTIRTEKMYDKLDLNFLGIQFRFSDKNIYGVESEYACPLIVRVFVDPEEEEISADWFKQTVNKKEISIPTADGGTKDTPVDFKFISLEEGTTKIATTDFLESMFTPFHASYNGRYPSADTTVVRKREEVYAGKRQYIYEIADQMYEKPMLKRSFNFLSNHISTEEGIISMDVKLNKDYIPSIQIRYAAPMTPEKIWEKLQAPKWTITYKGGEVKEQEPMLEFKNQGTVYKAE